MDSTKRLAVWAVVLAALMVLPVVETHAQNPACAGLAAADCKILSAADANLAKESPFKFVLGLSLKYKIARQSGSMDLKGDGVFDGDLQALAASDPAALNTVKMTLDLSGSVNVGQTLSGGSLTTTSHLIVADGNLYFRNNEADQWRGMNLADAVARNQSANLLGGSTSNASTKMLQDLVNDPQFKKAIAAIPTIKGFITIQKTKNTPELEGQKQVEFVYTYNIQTLVKAKELYPVYRAIMKASGSTISYSNTQLAQIGQTLGTMLYGTTLKITRWVGVKDNQYHAYFIDLALRLNMGIVGQSANSGTFDFHFLLKVSQVGQPVDVVAPEGADMIDTSE